MQSLWINLKNLIQWLFLALIAVIFLMGIALGLALFGKMVVLWFKLISLYV